MKRGERVHLDTVLELVGTLRCGVLRWRFPVFRQRNDVSQDSRRMGGDLTPSSVP